MSTLQNPWSLLGLQPGASEAELHAAWRKAAAACHPDRDPDGAERFIALQTAYKVLTDPRFAESVARDPEVTFEGELWMERRRAQMKRRRARLGKLYGR